MPNDLTPWLMRDFGGNIEPTPPAPSWYEQAACFGSDIDFVEPGSRHATRAALALCEGCPVREPCASYADAQGFTYGIWGGATEKARAQARKGDRAA